MKRWTTLALLGAMALVAHGQDLQQQLKDLEVGDHWIYNDYPKAVATAKETGKPIFVLFR